MTDPVLTYYDISPQVVAFSTTRRGGCSVGNYGEFNVNYYCGDKPSHIAANRLALCRLLQISDDRLVYPHQVHGTEVRRIGKDFLRLGDEEKAQHLEGVDAVMTDVRQLCIGVSTADCIPILLYDEDHQAVCAIHAGWRGTVARIAMKAIETMSRAYGTDAAHLKAIVGPGISLDSFEVGDEVYEQFAAAGFTMEKIARRYPALAANHQPAALNSGHAAQKWHIDLWACNRLQLEEAGISSENIQVAGICTYQHSDEFFSARRLGTDSGRILTAILLR